MRRRRATEAALATALALALAGCADDGRDPDVPSPTRSSDTAPDGRAGTQTGPSEAPDGATPAVDEVVASGLSVPWGVDFLRDGTALVTERDSRRVLAIDPDGTVDEVGEVAEAAPEGEGGLLGLAVDPASAGRDVYVYATTEQDNRVLRAELVDGRLGPAEVVLDGIPKGYIHDGGRLVFGPDGRLYVSTGETGEPALAQDPDSLAGKILRITTDGEPAPGNPDPGSPVWSLGHRNVQGLAFDDAGRLWASEFGDSTYDEVNLIQPGSNYGWPEVEGPGGGEEFVDPLVTWPTSLASPSGMAWADGALWVGALRGERLWRVPVRGDRLGEPTAFLEGDFGRLRTVVTTPDGDLWVTTSNRDGRGAPAEQDDRILRVRLSG
jgi:glucose/arabinose dehydrogenase